MERGPVMEINCGEPIATCYLMTRTWLDQYIYPQGRLGNVGLFHVIVCLVRIWYPVPVEECKGV